MKSKKLGVIILLLIFSLFSQEVFSYTMISEKEQSIIKNAVEKISDANKAEGYIQKLNKIEHKITPSKISIFDYLVKKIDERRQDILKEYERRKEGAINNDLLTPYHFSIPKEYYHISERMGKIVRINKNYEFRDTDNRIKRVLPSFYIKMENRPNFIRTVLRTYKLEDEIMMIEGENVYISIQGYKIEEEINLDYIKKNSGKYVQFSDGIKKTGLGVAVGKVDNIDYVLDTTSYEYSTLPNKPFYFSSYLDLESISDWVVSKTNEKELTLFTKNAHFYRFPFYVNKRLANRDKNLAYLGADLLHYTDNRQKSLNDSMTWQRLVFFTKDLISAARSDEEKVDIIYGWLTKNISYDYSVYDYVIENNINLSTDTFEANQSSFGGLGTFERRIGVCQGIVRLLYYMLSIAGIEDVEVIDGKANNGEVYIEHSWLKIKGKYYDPTFDLGGGTKKRPYLYKGLPKDILYASRDYKDNYDWSKADSDKLKEKYYNELLKVYLNYSSKGEDWRYPIFEYELKDLRNYINK